MSIFEFASKTAALRLAAPVAAALLATTCGASAGTLTYTSATITGLPINFSPTDSGYAGQIHLVTADGSVNVWCADLFDSLSLTGGTYTILPSTALLTAPGVPPGMNFRTLGEIGGLKRFGDAYLANISADPNAAAAVQIAIWSLEYGSAFTYDPLGPPVDGPLSYVTGLLDAVSGGFIPRFYGFFVMEEAGNQTLIADSIPGITPFTVVPETSTWAMMLLGFAGLGFAGFRNAKAKAALA